jgi:hypothetical protein
LPTVATAELLQPFARELPRGVAWLRDLPWPVAAALLALGLLGLLLGARHRRGVAAMGGLAVGAVAGLTLAAPALKNLSLDPTTSALVCAVAVSGLSFAVPWVFPFALGAVIGAPLGAHIPVGVPVLGPALGAVAVGGVLVIASKFVAASAAGLLGGAMVVAGVLAISSDVAALRPLATHPVVAVGVALVLAVAGAAGQVEGAWGAGVSAKKKARKPSLEQPKSVADDD